MAEQSTEYQAGYRAGRKRRDKEDIRLQREEFRRACFLAALPVTAAHAMHSGLNASSALVEALHLADGAVAIAWRV